MCFPEFLTLQIVHSVFAMLIWSLFKVENIKSLCINMFTTQWDCCGAPENVQMKLPWKSGWEFCKYVRNNNTILFALEDGD
jgi:hypothetical protein